MELIGFSTGAVAYGDFRRALRLLDALDVSALELSAIRLPELQPLLESLDDLDLSRYRYISFHAPSKFAPTEEQELVRQLAPVVSKGWPIILHPDSIHDVETWRAVQDSLCFENMDKRKPMGRTAAEMKEVFRRFPKSKFCLDLGHAHQVDRTMTEARLLVQQFSDRIAQIHVSEVNTNSEHEALSLAAMLAFEKVMDLIASDVPLIIESVVHAEGLRRELTFVRRIFTSRVHPHLIPD